uniref:Major sperm protein n=1 Tax=Caenorhabditis japonica TaxID=281687 RepID=A0A8R1HKT7_CAEJA
MTMFIAFILLVNAIISSTIMFQCASQDRSNTHKSGKSSKSHRSPKHPSGKRRSKSSRRRKSSATSSRLSKSSKSSKKSKKSSKSSKSRSARKSSKSSKSAKSIRPGKLGGTTGESLNRVQASLLADRQAAIDAAKPVRQPEVVDVSESNKISYANIRVIPHEVSFRPIGGLKSVRVKNLTGKRTAFMVKCSDNILFSINPVYGVIESEKEAQIHILRENAEPKHDKIVIITAPHPETNASAEQTFAQIYQNNSPEYSISVVPLLAQ